MPSKKVCVYHKCGATSVKNKDLSFFSFPSDETRQDEWIQRTKLFELHLEDSNAKNIFICSRHFEEKYISRNTRRVQLVNTATPIECQCSEYFDICPSSSNVMENLMIKTEQEDINHEAESVMKVKIEPDDGDFFTTFIDIQEHPVKLEDEMEQRDPLICDLTAPDTDISEHQQPHVFDHKYSNTPSSSVTKTLKFICEHCWKCFVSRKSLADHMRRVHTMKRHSCDVCSKQFSTKYNLKIHSYIHSSKLQYAECLDCKRKFPNPVSLYRHTKKFHHTCNICKEEFTDTSELKYHRNRVHNIDEVLCDFCRKTFDCKAKLIKHMLDIHLPVNKYICDICKKPMENKYSLQIHKEYIHNTISDRKKYRCYICNMYFNSNNSLYQHKQIKHKPVDIHNKTGDKCNDDIKYTCDICKKVFTSNKTLYSHRYRVHKNNGSYPCGFCNKVFAQPFKLNRHINYMHLYQDVLNVLTKRS